jgi:hypothetical protein
MSSPYDNYLIILFNDAQFSSGNFLGVIFKGARAAIFSGNFLVLLLKGARQQSSSNVSIVPSF